ncbi:hypothetical protein GCM10022395_18290 [Snuella lapsa]|uniref:Protein PsiE n=2 Tax=Snuella lapsa TaxID=870481 RepID=A0ABP6XKQ2_9FLAO
MLNNSSIFDFSQTNVKKENLFIVHVQGLVAGVLLITIIIELIQSLLIYLKTSQHALQLTILYQIALIAVVRHLFIIDFEHANGQSILGLALLIFVLGALSFVNRPKIIQRIINSKKDEK